ASPVPVVPAVYDYAATLFTGRVDLFAVGSDAGVTDSPGSVVEPASAPAAVAVGAQCWANLFLHPPYHSRGPTIDGRPEPALLAPDGVSTATYGPPGPCFNGSPPAGFAGTSASSAHAAAAAALVKQRVPAAGAAQLQTLLVTNAPDDAGLW